MLTLSLLWLMGSYCSWYLSSFHMNPIILWNTCELSGTKRVLCTSCALESAISLGSPGSFQWNMMLRIQELSTGYAQGWWSVAAPRPSQLARAQGYGFVLTSLSVDNHIFTQLPLAQIQCEESFYSFFPFCIYNSVFQW